MMEERRSRSLQRRNTAGNMVLLLILSTLCFYLGYSRSIASGIVGNNNNNLALRVKQHDNNCAQKLKEEYEQRFIQIAKNSDISEDSSIFPPSSSDYAAAMLHVSREELMKTYGDFGLPSAGLARGSEAIIIYNNLESIPDDLTVRRDALYKGGKASVSTALSNCDSLNVIFTDSGHQRSDYNQCLVLIGDNVPSYHQFRYERLPPLTEAWEKSQYHVPLFDASAELRHIPRANMNDGKEDFSVPASKLYQSKGGFVHEHWLQLITFIDNIDKILEELKAVVDPIVKDNTVIVMTVNKGQSVLLSNFVCAARSRGLDVSNVLVFPTDLEAEKVAKGLGLATYFDKINLGSLPEGEAVLYGDEIFSSMMFAKILTVLYISLLGHDVLFQDVDIVWIKNPLTFFHDKSNTDLQKFDVLCQDDGSIQPRFSPLSANSGFYYVRANEKTRYLFTSFLYHTVIVSLSGSHQQVMIQLLQDYSSLFGLHVKIFDKVETEFFPCGWQFFRRKDFMKRFVQGESDAFIYHSSWTSNKADKLKYLQQLGEWYVQDKCHNSVDEIMGGKTLKSGALANECCSAEALVKCYYRDVPSKIPCKSSPTLDPGGKDFWEE